MWVGCVEAGTVWKGWLVGLLDTSGTDGFVWLENEGLFDIGTVGCFVAGTGDGLLIGSTSTGVGNWVDCIAVGRLVERVDRLAGLAPGAELRVETSIGRSEGCIDGEVLSLSHQMRTSIPGKSLSDRCISSTVPPVPKYMSLLIEKQPFVSKLPTTKFPPVLVLEYCSRHCSWVIQTTAFTGGIPCDSSA